MKARIWVTGASGMLGCVLVPHLNKLGWNVTSLSRTGRESTLALDLSKSEAVAAFFEKEKPQIVIHSAAYSDVDGCELDPDRAFQANAISTKNLADCCGPIGVPLIYVSTDYVFDGLQKTPYSETDPTHPISIYGLSKLIGEWYAGSCSSGGAIVRTSWLFGAPNPANFVNAILTRLKKEKEVAVLDEQTGCPTSVKDLSVALEKIAARFLSAPKKSPVCVYHVCNQGGTTRFAMTRAIQEWLHLPTVVKTTQALQHRPALRPLPYSVMSCARFEADFGMKMRPWQEAAREFVTDSSACASS